MVCLLLFDRHTYTAAWRREDCMKHGMTAASVGLLAGALVLSAPIGLFRAGTAHAGEELSLNRASVQELTELELSLIHISRQGARVRAMVSTSGSSGMADLLAPPLSGIPGRGSTGRKTVHKNGGPVSCGAVGALKNRSSAPPPSMFSSFVRRFTATVEGAAGE